MDRGEGTSPRFKSTGKGLILLSELLDELSIPATFFAEARTLEHLKDLSGCLSGHEVGAHGYLHEDLTLLSKEEGTEVIRSARDAIKDVVGRAPSAFRAPYMSAPSWLDEVLADSRFSIDSSRYADPGSCTVQQKCNGLAEVPVARYTGSKTITSYLWPMHEGKRGWETFGVLEEGLPPEGTLVLADHCWHIAESVTGGTRSEEDVGMALDNVRKLLEHFIDRGFRPLTMTDSCKVPKINARTILL